MIVCEVCQKGPAAGTTVFRVNPKGVPGIWRCREHLPFDKQPDRELDLLVTAIEKGGKS